MDVASIVINALQIIAGLVPGFLAAFSGHQTDDEAIEAAEKAVSTIPTRPAQTSIETWRQHLAQAKKKPS